MDNPFYKRDCISIKDFSPSEILSLTKLASAFKKKQLPNPLQGTVLANCFFEPSTRTRLSFEAAMQRLGGSVIGFSEAKGTSYEKGETFHDSIKVIEGYADVIVLRHPKEGAARYAAEIADVPVINAGDGANEHPTQTLVDLFTILELKGQLDNLSIAFVGDLKYGRTVHSLVEAMSFFSPRMYFVSPETLSLPQEVLRSTKRQGIMFSCHRRIEDVLPYVDIVYMTRLQKERFLQVGSEESIQEFRLTKSLLEKAKSGVKVLHPLPRNQEIAIDVDATDAAAYFEQARNGVYVRQALLYATVTKKGLSVKADKVVQHA
jgi:aspartate carbamoyltransferase catalytic subunit